MANLKLRLVLVATLAMCVCIVGESNNMKDGDILSDSQSEKMPDTSGESDPLLPFMMATTALSRFEDGVQTISSLHMGVY